MKKFLSLVLALVMTMSLVTVSASAKEFSDDDSITYDEAVAVISEIGVVDGYEDGTFGPTATLTRQAAAKIICNLILGPTTAAELSATVAPFPDVPATSQFAGYIAYCAKEGIISGYANGNFGPGNTLTGYAFMKMLLGALGYRADIEGYNDTNTWAISVAKQAIGIGLNASLEGDFVGQKAVTREEACLYAFNTLKADLVEYNTVVNANVNGTQVTVGNLEANSKKWSSGTSATRSTIKGDNYIQFAEQYFPKLVLTEGENDFGEPSRTWKYESKDLGTWVNTDLLVESYNAKVTGATLYELIGKNVLDEYRFAAFIDGVAVTEANSATLDSAYFVKGDLDKNNKDKIGDTGDGVLTEVFIDSDPAVEQVTVVIINTYLAKADRDYDSKKDEASFSVYGVSNKGTSSAPIYVKTLTDGDDHVTMKTSAEDHSVVADVLSDEIYLVKVADGEIQKIQKAEVIEDAEITAFKKTSNVVSDGTTYNYASTAEYDAEVLDHYTSTTNGTNLKDVTYNIYLDEYQNLIGIELVEETNNFVFITGVDDSYSNLSTKNFTASAIFLDGSMKTITAKAASTSNANDQTASSLTGPTVNKWYTYTVSSDNVYTLKIVGNATGNANDAYIPGGTNNSTKYGQYTDLAGDFTTASPKTIDTKNIYLYGASDSAPEFRKVYGNDNTVYLTVSVKKIATSASNNAIIVDDVESVTTGVKNANITVWGSGDYTTGGTELYKVNNNGTAAANANQRTSGVYTLYKSNGYVIAAVVVGEDAASSKNLVYVSTKTGDAGVEQESYDKTNDEWTWTRKVIQGGQEVELKEVGDSLQYLNDMTQYEWYQVKLNANDEVIGVEPVATALTTGKTRFVNNITDLDTVENTSGVETVLYSQSFLNSKPSMKNNTLYVTSTIAANNGFYVSDTANIALIETVKNKQETTYETGAKALQSIIETLNQNNAGGFNYDISAVIEDGIATSVVIYDRTKNGTTTSSSSSSSDIMVVLPDRTGHVLVYTTRDAGKLTLDEAIAAITTEIENKGYTITDGPDDYGSGNIQWEVKKNGLTRYFYYNDTADLSAGQVFVTVDGNTVPVNSATKTVAAATNSASTYVRVVDKKQDIDTIVVGTDSTTTLSADSVLTTGYYKVVLSGATIDGTNISTSNLVKSNGDYYALGTAVVKAGTSATGTGVKYNTDKYGAYGVVTYATIAANDNDGDAKQATIAAVGQVKLTTISSSDTTGNDVKAVAYNTTNVLSTFSNSARYALNGAVYTYTAQAPTSVKLTGDTVYEEVYTITVASGSEPTSTPAKINTTEASYTIGYTKNSYVSILGTNSWYVKASDAANAIITVTVNCSNKSAISSGKTDTITVTASDATVGAAATFTNSSTSVQKTINVSNPTRDITISYSGANA